MLLRARTSQDTVREFLDSSQMLMKSAWLSRRHLLITGYSAALIPLAGCGGPPSAKTALLAAKAFVDALLLLDQVSKIFQNRVSAAVNATKRQLAVPGTSTTINVDLSKVALDWEENWKSVAAQTDKLVDQFGAIKRESDNYWAVLESVTSSIADRGLRDGEEKKNKDAKKRWDSAYEAAAVNIEKAKALRDKGTDMQKVMLAAALRRQLAEYTTTLDSIAREAETLLRSLETLTEQGRTLVSLAAPSK